jgi:hypothetical protein
MLVFSYNFSVDCFSGMFEGNTRQDSILQVRLNFVAETRLQGVNDFLSPKARASGLSDHSMGGMVHAHGTSQKLSAGESQMLRHR